MEITCKGFETKTRFIDEDINFLKVLIHDYCEVPEDAYYDKESNTVKTVKDVSYHGSPEWEYTTFNLSPFQLEVFKNASCLIRTMKEEKDRIIIERREEDKQKKEEAWRKNKEKQKSMAKNSK